MIEIAKENFPEANFEVQDARALKEGSESFDCVLLMHCLDHLDRYQDAIKEAARVSRKYVCIILWRPFVTEGTNLNSINTMGREDGTPWEDTHLQEYSKELLEEEFKKNNLFILREASGKDVNDNEYGSNFLYFLQKV
jgi:ubiquinone/menaquinone biosynthesis C-methylase UbiE